jgi:glutamate/tyrosine decarboxylase-like PLP-dependent enzyme
MEGLEAACYQALKSHKKIACINALGGTTSNMGIDDMKKIYDLRNRLVKEFNLDYIPHIHSDAVLGWAYLVFAEYDFENNPLQFTLPTLKKIKKILKRISTLKYVDSFGVDFHKTGFVAYNSSMIMVKNRDDFKLLRREGDVMTPLFHDDSAYNPGKYTLETSRSAANMLATWVALQTFGYEGYQVLLGHALEMGQIYRDEIELRHEQGLFVANQESFGPDVFIRCYPPKTPAAKTFKQEMNDDELLAKNTAYTTAFANWLEEEGYPHRDNGFAISRSSAAIYTHTTKPMVALRIYPLSPFIEAKHAKELIKRLADAKKLFDQKVTHA